MPLEESRVVKATCAGRTELEACTAAWEEPRNVTRHKKRSLDEDLGPDSI